MRRSFILVVFSIFLVIQSFSQDNSENSAWNVTLPVNRSATSTITAQNRCTNRHKFEIRTENADFLKILEKEIEVSGGENATVRVQFVTNGLKPGVYKGTVFIICKTCSKEKTCTQDREKLPVVLTVPSCGGRCIIQKISIFNTRGKDNPVRKYMYKLVLTEIYPIKADGNIDLDNPITFNPESEKLLSAEAKKLKSEVEKAQGKSLGEMLDAVSKNKGKGYSIQTFGCEGTCQCVEEKTKLPNGEIVENPVSRAGPQDSIPPLTTVIRKFVRIPGKKEYMIAYHIEFKGSIEQARGVCQDKGK